MGLVDRPHMTDGIAASLEAVPVAPAFPCPKCGAESRSHGEAPRHDESERICSGALCREVQPCPEEVARVSESDSRPRFPCMACGRETKLHKAGRSGVSIARVCSVSNCRHIFTP